MQTLSYIDYSKTNYFNKIVLDYLSPPSNNRLQNFYKYPFSLNSFEQAIKDKSKENIDRKTLVKTLKKQYEKIPATRKVLANIDALLNDNTFTITTGHQLCLFTGPLYFIYKIISTITATEQLNKTYPDKTFVPVYWMVSEDHDFDEINHVHIFGKRLTWQGNYQCPCGRISPHTIASVIDELEAIIGDGVNAKYLITLFRQAYLKHDNLAEATLYLINQLFGNYGLIIINPDNAILKNSFKDIIKDDILNNTNYKLVNNSIAGLKAAGYPEQVKPREINIFYIEDNIRARIVSENNMFHVLNTNIHFTKDQLLKEIDDCPQKFGPNVITRPLYQEKILPNLAYIGGGAEIAYWLEYKTMFEHHNINFPALLLRNSVLWMEENSYKKINKLGLTDEQLFFETNLLIKEFVSFHSNGQTTLNDEILGTKNLFEKISLKAETIDKGLKDFISGECARQIKSLQHIEQRLIKAQKLKYEIQINQIKNLKEKLFPENLLQERHENFIPYYISMGEDYFNFLIKNLNPFDEKFCIIKMSDER